MSMAVRKQLVAQLTKKKDDLYWICFEIYIVFANTDSDLFQDYFKCVS